MVITGKMASLANVLFRTTSAPSAWTTVIRMFGLRYVPLLAACRPRIMVINEDRAVIRMPLDWVTGNHVKSMYFGALTIGADVSGGILAMHHCRTTGNSLVPLFKDLNAEFLKRANDDVYFVCDQGSEVRRAVLEAAGTGDRVNRPVLIRAYCDKPAGGDLEGDWGVLDPVATFRLTLSLKKMESRK